MDKFLLSIFTALLCLLPARAATGTVTFPTTAGDWTEYTWTKSGNDYTANVDGYTFTLEKGSYNSGNLVSPDSESIRVYAGANLTITAPTGTVMTLVEGLTASSSKATGTSVNGTNWKNETGTIKAAADQPFKFTAATGQNSITFSGNKQLRIKSITITYTAPDATTAPEAPVFSTESGDIAAGTEVTVTSKGATTLHYVIDGGTEQTVESSSYTFTVDSDMSIEAWGENKIGTSSRETANYTTIIGVPVFTPAPGEVVAGTKITITSQGATKIFFKVNDVIVPQEWPADNCTYTVDAACKIEAWAEDAKFKQSEHKIVNYTIKTTTTTDYELVKNGDTFANGDRVLVVTQYNNKYYAMTKNVSSSRITAKEISVTNNVITLEDSQTDYEVLTVMEGTDTNVGKFALKGSNGYVINGSSTNTTFNTDVKNATYSNVTFYDNADNVKWFISSDRWMRGFNGENFRAYASDSYGQPIYIFRVPTAKTPVTLAAAEDLMLGVNETRTPGSFVTVAETDHASAAESVVIAINGTDNQVISIEADGSVKGLKAGTQSVTASIPNSDKTYKSEAITFDITVKETKCAAPVFKNGETTLANNAVVPVGSKITLSTATEGATITYIVTEEGATAGEEKTYDAANGIVLKAGVYTLTATASKDGLEPATTIVSNLEIAKNKPTLGFKEAEQTVYISSLVNGEKPIANELINANNLLIEQITFSSDHPEVADIDDLTNEIIFKGKGQTTITAAYTGDENNEAVSASYILKVELTKPQSESFTLKFNEESNGNYSSTGTDIAANTALTDIFEQGADKVLSFSDYASIKYNSRGGLRMGSNDNPGKITFTLDKAYTIKSITAKVSNWRTDGKDAVKLYINDKERVSQDDPDITPEDPSVYTMVRHFDFSNTAPTDMLTLATKSGANRIFVYYLDIECEGGELEPPVAFDEFGKWMPKNAQGGFDEITETDFIRFEHESGVEIYYSAVAKAGAETPQAAPARVAAANSLTADGETYTLLATEDDENKVSGIFNPYAADSGVDFTKGGTLKVLAKKGEVMSQPHTFTFAAVPTGVEGIEADAADGAEYYTLQGVRVANPDKGVYIRVLNGKAVKVAL